MVYYACVVYSCPEPWNIQAEHWYVHYYTNRALSGRMQVRMLRGPQRVSVQMVGRRLQRVQADASIVPVTVDGQPGALFSAICTNANQPPNPRQELSLVARGQGPLPATYRGFFIHTTDFHITAAFSGHMNQTLFGRPSAFWVSESPYTHIHPEDVQVVRGLHKEAVQSSQAVMLYDRVNDGSRGWSMCENLLLPCINRNTGQVQYLASTTWLQEEGSSSMPTRISESKCVPNTEPIFFGSLLELTERFSQMAVQARDAHAASVEALESGKEARIMEEFVKTKLQPQRISVTTHQGPNPDIVLPHNYMSKDESTTPAGFTPIPEGVMSVLAALPPDQINSGIVHALRSYGLVPYTNPDGTVTAQTFPVPGVDFSLPGANENSNQLKALNTASLNSNAANVSIGNVPTNQQTPPGRNIPGNSTSLPHDSHHHSTANNPFLIGRLSFVPDQSMPMPGNHSQHTSQQPNLVHPNPAFHLPSSNAHQHRVDAWGHNQIQNQPPNPSNQSNQSGGTVSMETDHVISQAQQAPPFLGLRPAAPMSAREAEMMHAIEQHLFMMENMDSTNVNTSGMK
eukprot:comp23592_c1_seq1/m.40031 comp23592_c1_seq1/g.40031  ORF comp23592_c1_seq1/g.40031 comp23592_c1_seq1/m.40031 type:complete len:570 (-) comp23592_c1_seq1:615-2324(-)